MKEKSFLNLFLNFRGTKWIRWPDLQSSKMVIFVCGAAYILQTLQVNTWRKAAVGFKAQVKRKEMSDSQMLSSFYLLLRNQMSSCTSLKYMHEDERKEEKMLKPCGERRDCLLPVTEHVITYFRDAACRALCVTATLLREPPGTRRPARHTLITFTANRGDFLLLLEESDI